MPRKTYGPEQTIGMLREAARNGELRREADGIQRKIAGIMVAIEDGMYTPALKERMTILEQRRAEIEGLLAGALHRSSSSTPTWRKSIA